MKKIINAVDQVENQMIEGMVKAYPQYLKKLDCGNVVVRADKKEGKVALISGGGSGRQTLPAVLPAVAAFWPPRLFLFRRSF